MPEERCLECGDKILGKLRPRRSCIDCAAAQFWYESVTKRGSVNGMPSNEAHGEIIV